MTGSPVLFFPIRLGWAIVLTRMQVLSRGKPRLDVFSTQVAVQRIFIVSEMNLASPAIRTADPADFGTQRVPREAWASSPDWTAGICDPAI